MPNHWESSARPLFVKTVFVNGNRHAILFEKDPLLRGVNSPLKKSSRPTSSLSFASDLSISSSEESQNSERKISKFKNIGRGKEKNLSSELQSCLIKFKLASDGSKNKNKVDEEKFICNSLVECKGKRNSKQKRQKENQNKSGKQCEHFYKEQNEIKLTESKNGGDKSCYIYNLENYKRRKNYCFVKITSQPPQFILNCSCESDWNKTHNCNPRNKNNLVISASIQNLVMTSNENENLLEKTLDYVLPFENPQFHWDNYLTKSYYNSLAERVFQWLDMARKRKKPPERLSFKEANDCETSVERICSGKKFVEEIKRNENSLSSNNKVLSNRKNGKVLQSDTSEEENEEKVIREENVETLLSMEKIKNNPQECSEKTNSQEKFLGETVRGKTQQPFNSSPDFNLLTNSDPFVPSKESNLSILNIIKTPLKIQDLFLNSSSKDSKLFQNRSIKKTKEFRNAIWRQNKIKETDLDEAEADFIIKEEGNKREVLIEKFDNRNKHPQCSCSRNLDKNGDNKNSQILTEEFAERNQKSINNLNITRTRPVIMQNLSPQQHDKIFSSEEEKAIWASEKNTRRPQLHIFMPSVLLKDQSDDSMSECENFLNS